MRKLADDYICVITPLRKSILNLCSFKPVTFTKFTELKVTRDIIMPAYRLIYFETRGAAEVSRMVFKVAGIEFEDVRYSQENWPSKKPGMCIICVAYVFLFQYMRH